MLVRSCEVSLSGLTDTGFRNCPRVMYCLTPWTHGSPHRSVISTVAKELSPCSVYVQVSVPALAQAESVASHSTAATRYANEAANVRDTLDPTDRSIVGVKLSRSSIGAAT